MAASDFFCFHTYNRLECEDPALLEEGRRLCLLLDSLLSHTRTDSDVYRLNHAGGAWVSVSPHTAELLQMSGDWHRISGGTFNPFVHGAKAMLQDGQLPPLSPIPFSVERDGDAVRIPAGASLDFGSIAKGYAADLLAELFRSRGTEHALIDLGGNVLALGGPWQVGLRSPGSETALSRILSVTGLAVVTSGDYERGISVNGRSVHHIIDPRTGQPASRHLSSVTVVSPSAADADALSTIVTVLGIEAGYPLLASRGAELFCVTEDGECLYSPGMRKFFL